MDESAIFDAARKIADKNERQQFLDQACAGEAELRTRIEELLWAHDHPISFLDDPAARALDLEATRTDPVLEQPGSHVGPYKLLEEIGEGGMGIVYMAEQTAPVKRRVALKIIKPGLDTRQVIARFEAERQALAMMDHPNIAKVLDAGATASGRPFFVMELVHGVSLIQYCDEQQLTPRARLNLFIDVCHAVQHAHQKGVIHRDLKPSNILVAEYDHKPIPKIIDFGVAKATSQNLTEKTLFTHFGQVVGTLEYMSPEQAKRNQLDIDTRSDIYSLGVVLYELLTGETPFSKEHLKEAAFEELLRIIREEEPPRPSVKLSSSAMLAVIAAKRSVEPRKLSGLIRGDLDWIVMKALEKNRSRRYASATELAGDLLRHLAEEPVLAGPPSLPYRLRKFVLRNRVPLAFTAVLALLLLVAGIWFITDRQTEQRRIADRTQRLSAALQQASLALGQAVSSPLTDESHWIAARASRDRVKDLLAEGPIEPSEENRAREFIFRLEEAEEDRSLRAQIEEVVIFGATHPDRASWTRMEENFRAFFKVHGFDLDQTDPLEIARRIREHRSAEGFVDALELWIGTRGQLSALGGPRATRENMQPWADAIYSADSDPVRTGIRRLIYSGRLPKREEVDSLLAGRELGSLSPRGLSWLANVYLLAGAAAEADRIYEDAIQQHPTDVMLNFDYGYSLALQQRWEEAIRYYLRCLVLRPEVAGLWQSLGIAYRSNNELQRSRVAFERAIEFGPDYGPTHVDLARTLFAQGEFEAVITRARQAVTLAPDSPAAYGLIGRALMAQGKYAEALPELEKCHQLGSQDRGWKEPSAEWLRECRARLR